MSKGSDITKKQHYIPQVYLRGFSPEYKRNNGDLPLSRYTIFCHDLTVKDQIKKAIPVKSICYSENLYEVTDCEGKIVLGNRLERFFSELEKMFGNYRHELERKAFIEDNYRTKCFLTSEEKVFWVAYILIQILRLPQILDLAERTSLEILGKQININQAQNIAKRFCLPFFEEMKEDSQETAVFNALFNLMKNMSFAVGVDKRARIITSDKPVYIYSKEYPCEEYERIIFPITSEICLFMFGGEDKKRYPKNSLFPIGDDGREEILKSMADSSFGKIYSNHLLDKKEKKFVEEVLIEKEAKTCPTLTL